MKYILIITIAVVSYVIGYKNQKTGDTQSEYHFNVDSTGYDIYSEDMELIGRINYGENKSLDSLIDLDNQ